MKRFVSFWIFAFGLATFALPIAIQVQTRPSPLVYVPTGGIIAQDLTITTGQTVWLEAGQTYYYNTLTIQSNATLAITNKTFVAKWTQIVCTNYVCAGVSQNKIFADSVLMANTTPTTNAVVAWDGTALSYIYPATVVGANGHAPSGGTGNVYGGGGGSSGNHFQTGHNAFNSAGTLYPGSGGDGYAYSTGTSILALFQSLLPGQNGVYGGVTTYSESTELDSPGGMGGMNGGASGCIYFKVLNNTTTTGTNFICAVGQKGGSGANGNDCVNLDWDAWAGDGGAGGSGGNSGRVVISYRLAGLTGTAPAAIVTASTGGSGGAGGIATSANSTSNNGQPSAAGSAGSVGSTSTTTF